MPSSIVCATSLRPLTRMFVTGALVWALAPAIAFGQSAKPAEPGWSFRTRVQLTGSSDSSEPEGYTVYSGVPIEMSVRRDIGRLFAVEVSAALESREVDTERAGVSRRVNLGSIQTLPLNALFLVRPWGGGRMRPYAGLGANLTVFWEKSGALDSMDLKPSVGLAVQLGTDIALSNSALLNLDLKWNQLETDLESDGAHVARLSINPLSIGIGLGFRF